MAKRIIQNRISGNRSAWGRRLAAFALCFAMAFSMLPAVSVSAGNTLVDLDDLYLLRVDTGTLSGENVLYLGVHFKDDAGTEHTEFIFPHEGDLSYSYQLAASSAEDTLGGRLKNVNRTSKYTVTGYDDRDGLQTDSTDMYLFSPHFKIAELLDVDVFLRYPMNSANTKGWTCNGIFLFDVDDLYGLGMAGYYSDDFYIQFSGKLLCRLDAPGGQVEFSLNKSDQLYRIGRDKDAGYGLVLEEREYSNYHNNEEYLFKLDIADTYHGGIESLASELEDNGRLLHPVEALTMGVVYEDIFGKNHCAYLPVITSALGWAVENGFTEYTLPIAGIAQQGESVIFAGNLPDLAAVERVQLIYGSQAAEMAGVDLEFGMRAATRQKSLDNDDFNLTGLSIYSGSDAEKVKRRSPSVALDLYLEDGCTPLYYYTSSRSDGDQITVGGTDYQMKPYSPGARLTPGNATDAYIVKVKTDTASIAGTAEELQFKLTYLATDGTTKTTPVMSLSEAAQEFYGYWPGKDGDISYLAGVSAGGTLTFPVHISGVREFVSATFIMSSMSNDDWQMTEIAIYHPQQIGNRVIKWEDIGISNRTITRQFDESDSSRVAWYPNPKDIEAAGAEGPEKIYLNGKNNQRTVTFNSSYNGGGSGKTTDEKKVVDWSELRYSMTYREALQDLGFTQSAVTYTVNVTVASNDSIGASDDCGSSNLFYFKLIFEDGASGYVLANQQLTSDGFRSGRTETFCITTNEDYGNLSAVSIIPETESDSDNRDIFDKLNIQEICVTKGNDAGSSGSNDAESAGGLSQTWKIQNVGWIGIEYFDKGAESTVTGRKGRTEGELARTYNVTQSGYSMNLLISMTTGCYDKRVTDVDYTPGAKYPQYEGSLTATIEYYDTDDALRKMPVDVARAMYEYADKAPQYETNSDGMQLQNARVDTGFMLREGHVDRFIVTIPDVKQVVRIRFDACGKVSTTWRLDNVSVRTIESDGVLQLTTTGEYRRSNKTSALCESTSAVGYTLKTMAPDRKDDILGEEQELTVTFTQNTIDVSTEAGTWGTSIKREPINRNDTLNVYVYMSDDNKVTSMRAYELDAAILYHTTLDDDPRQISVKGLQKDTTGRMFYATGLKAEGLDAINKLYLSADSYDEVNAPMKYIVIQHVRSGVTINTYYINAQNVNLARNQEFTVADSESEPNPKEQIVRLYFSPMMEDSVALSEDGNNVLVGIRYKTENDVENTYYSSRYVYLTDLTDTVDGVEKPRYSEIKAGTVVEIPFNESFVSEITGVVVASAGNFNAVIDSACVGVYDAVSGKIVDWFNFAEPQVLTGAPQAMTPTETTVVPITMRFTTTESASVLSSDSDSGNPAPIRLNVTYVSAADKTCQTAGIKDIRNYLKSGNFVLDEEGKATAEIEFFMKDVESIRYITLEPYTTNPYGSASWGLGQFRCTAIIDQIKKSRDVAVNQLVVQDKPVTVNFSTVLVELTAAYYDEGYGVTHYVDAGTEDADNVVIHSGQSVMFTPKISGTVDGMGYIISAKQKIGTALAPVYCYLDNGKTFTFYPPENENTGEVQTYVVTVSSEEMPDVQASITINVLPDEDALKLKNLQDQTQKENNTQTETNTQTESGENSESSET